MLCELRRHPGSPCEAVDRIEVEFQRGGTTLLLRYRVNGRIRDIKMPPAAAPARRDELWKHTCFEAFLKRSGDSYCEFNLSPSTEWAAYGFSGYREGMKSLPAIAAAEIATELSDANLEVRAAIRLDAMADFVPTARLRLGLSAVIEETNGRKSYWALAHPPGNPDFHHPDCFTLELPPAFGA